jgi:hypothetical protein
MIKNEISCMWIDLYCHGVHTKIHKNLSVGPHVIKKEVHRNVIKL